MFAFSTVWASDSKEESISNSSYISSPFSTENWIKLTPKSLKLLLISFKTKYFLLFFPSSITIFVSSVSKLSRFDKNWLFAHHSIFIKRLTVWLLFSDVIISQ